MMKSSTAGYLCAALFAICSIQEPAYADPSNAFVDDAKKQGLNVALSLASLTAHPDASVTYTVTATLTNNSHHTIKDILFLDEFLQLYQVSLDNVTVSALVPSDRLPSLEDKIAGFTNDFFPKPLQPLSTSCKKVAREEAERTTLAQSLISLESSLAPGASGSITYSFTYFPLVDDPSFPLYSNVTIMAKSSDGYFGVDVQLPLGNSPVANPVTTRIAIVGGGLAGLTTAYNLVQAGLQPIVYEGSGRIGGRTFSGVLLEDQVFEHGGEFIDSDHQDIMDLAAELGLAIDDLVAGQKPGTKDIYQVIDYDVHPPKKIPYSIQEATDDYFNTFDPGTGMTIFQLIVTFANDTYPTNSPPPGPATPWPLAYGDLPLAIALDAMNLNEFIDEVTAFLRKDRNGSKTKLAQFLKTAYVQEFGAEPDQQSALNIVYLLGFQELPSYVQPPNVTTNYFQPYGISDQRFHIQGGNARISERIMEYLQQNHITVRKEYRLTKITFHGAPYSLSFDAQVNGQSESVTPPDFDHIVLAIPFAAMREEFSSDGKPLYKGHAVDYSEANFSDIKQYAIQNLAMSRNSKVNVQFKNRFWREQGFDGNTYVTSNPYLDGKVGLEKTYENSWEVTRAQPGKRGILTAYTGGKKSQEYRTSYILKDVERKNSELKAETDQYLKQLNFLYRGATSKDNFGYLYRCQFPYKIKDEKPFKPYFSSSSSSSDSSEHKESIVNVMCDNWTESPWQRGAYSYWSSGQYISGQGQIIDGVVVPPGAVVPFAGIEGVPEPFDPNMPDVQNGTCHFAGEHTAYDNQGYMNGAVESGNRVANEILSEV